MSNLQRRRQLFVRSLSAASCRGWLDCGGLRIPCALGRSGRRANKHEGDGASPIGRLTVLSVHYRADRCRRPHTGLPVFKLNRRDGWCDAPADRNYNRPVRHPYPASAEHLWRQDGLYDVLVVLDYNIHPRCRGRGSAIFLHVADPAWKPTEGCIAVTEADMKLLLAVLGPGSVIHL